jgi:hypothetical protein
LELGVHDTEGSGELGICHTCKQATPDLRICRFETHYFDQHDFEEPFKNQAAARPVGHRFIADPLKEFLEPPRRSLGAWDTQHRGQCASKQLYVTGSERYLAA